MVEAAIQAVAKLHAEFAVHLAIVGSGDHQPLVRAAAQIAKTNAGKNIISVIGPMIDPLPCCQAADVVVDTARVALEVLSCRRPLIAGGNVSYVGYLEPENLQKAWAVYFGDHHWAYPLTVERLTGDLRYILQNPEEAEKNAKKLRTWARTNFDIKKIAQQTLQFYEDALADRELSSDLLPEPAVPEEQPAEKRRPISSKTLSSLDTFAERPLISVAIPAYTPRSLP